MKWCLLESRNAVPGLFIPIYQDTTTCICASEYCMWKRALFSPSPACSLRCKFLLPDSVHSFFFWFCPSHICHQLASDCNIPLSHILLENCSKLSCPWAIVLPDCLSVSLSFALSLCVLLSLFYEAFFGAFFVSSSRLNSFFIPRKECVIIAYNMVPQLLN